MPIRKRITDLHGHDYKEFARRRKEGPKPQTPRKPKLEERKPFTDALEAMPVGKVYSPPGWRLLTEPYIGDRHNYEIWGLKLHISPAARPTMDGDIECVGVFIVQRTKTCRGINPKITLKGEKRGWYRAVLDWLDENNFEG